MHNEEWGEHPTPSGKENSPERYSGFALAHNF
jgi:hypothetical protein